MKEKFLELNFLHVLNDGFEASFLLLVPFIAKELHISLTQVGFLGMLVNVFSILLGLPAGYLAVKFGSRKILLFALLSYLLGFFIAGISPSYLLMALAFSIGGIGFGLFHPISFALIAKNSEKQTRGKNIGNFTAIGDLGKILISGAVTFVVAVIGWRLTAFSYAGIGVVIFLSMIFFLRKLSETGNAERTEMKSQTHIYTILTDKIFMYASATNMFDSFASSSLYIFLPFLFLHKGINPVILGSFTAAFFVGNLFGKTLLGRFVDKFGNTKVFIVAELFMALFLVILANTNILLIIITSAVLLGSFTKGTVPVTQTMISDAAEAHGDFEKVFGVNATTVNIATMLAPLFLGIVSDKFGITTAFTTMAFFALLATIPAFAFHFERKKSFIPIIVE